MPQRGRCAAVSHTVRTAVRPPLHHMCGSDGAKESPLSVAHACCYGRFVLSPCRCFSHMRWWPVPVRSSLRSTMCDADERTAAASHNTAASERAHGTTEQSCSTTRHPVDHSIVRRRVTLPLLDATPLRLASHSRAAQWSSASCQRSRGPRGTRALLRRCGHARMARCCDCRFSAQ